MGIASRILVLVWLHARAMILSLTPPQTASVREGLRRTSLPTQGPGERRAKMAVALPPPGMIWRSLSAGGNCKLAVAPAGINPQANTASKCRESPRYPPSRKPRSDRNHSYIRQRQAETWSAAVISNIAYCKPCCCTLDVRQRDEGPARRKH